MRRLHGSLGTVPLLVLAMAMFAGPANGGVDYDTAQYYDVAMERNLFDE
jgi:hypothetical protein